MRPQLLLLTAVVLFWGASSFLLVSSHRRSSSSSTAAAGVSTARHAVVGCDGVALPSADAVHRIWGSLWGDACMVLHDACLDEGTFVTFGDSPYAAASPARLWGPGNATTATSTTGSSSSKQPPWLKQVKLGNNHLDFRGFGDVAGIVQYPPPIIRPGHAANEEAADMQPSTRTFSPCARPVVLYLNFVYAFGDWWLRSMPAFMHARAAGAWDTRATLVIATGGQRLARWQKLVLQTLGEQPIVTLSAASSRALAAPGQQQQPERQHRHALAAAARRRLQEQPSLTAYGRCFELVAVCSVPGARTFSLQQPGGARASSTNSSSHVPRETWAGAQHVKQYYQERFGQHSPLPRGFERLKQRRAFRVVFAVRGLPAAAAAPGGASGREWRDWSEAELAASTRQLLNLPQLLAWCNAWKPTAAAGSAALGDVSAGDTAGGSRRYERAACVAHEFGQHGRVEAAAATQQRRQGSALAADPELDPTALLTDLAVLEQADVVVGLHGAQLFNALFMPAHKALVEVRPFEFWGGWPATYFQQPLVKIDRDDSILWFGIDTVNASNSRPGTWERRGLGVPGTWARDRHTQLEPAALELMLRRVIWASEDPAAYKELKFSGLTHITDTLKPAHTFHAALKKARAAEAQQHLLQHKARPEIAAALEAARDRGTVGAAAAAAGAG